MNNTNISTLMNKILLSNTISYDNTRKYTTFYKILGSQSESEPGLGTSTSSGFLSNESRTVFTNSSYGTGLGYRTSIPASAKESGQSVYNYLRDKIASSELNGYVPADGDKYGINGSPESWANFLTNLAYIESGFNNNATGDIGKYVGGSNGLFQLSPNDAINYGFQKEPFTIDQLRDPNFNMDIAVKIATKWVKEDGSIALGGQGMARYWGPLSRGWTPSRDAVYASFSPAALKIASDHVTNSAQVAWAYIQSKASPNPITGQRDFYNAYMESFNELLDNYQKAEYGIYAKYTIPDSIADTIFPADSYSIDSILGPVSETTGFWATNVFDKYTDSVSPLFDFNSLGSTDSNFGLKIADFTTTYGGPFTLNASTVTKTPPYLFENLETASETTKAIENTNLVNILKPDSGTNVYSGVAQDQATSLSLNSDLPSYLSFYNNRDVYLEEFKNQFPNTFEYISFFSTINDTPGYNPRDYRAKNLEKMNEFYFDINIEGKVQTVDLLQKKYKHSISRRSIKRSLCVTTGCGTNNNKENEKATTEAINKVYLTQKTSSGNANVNNSASVIASTPAGPAFNSFTQEAASAVQSVNNFMAVPQQQVAELSYEINKLGIGNLPGGELLNSPIQDLLGSASELASITQMPLNLPNILPSIDPGSFPQIAGILLNTNWEKLDINTAISTAQEINKIVCDFRLPIVGKIDWNNITDIDFDNFGENFKKVFQGIEKKFEQSIKNIGKKIKNLIPNFIKSIENLFKSIFTCQGPNVKNSSNKTN